MDGLRGDLKFAVSSLRRSPAVAAAIVLCLSFGIGASTTVFSWMEGLVLRPLPAVKDVDRLVTIRWAAGSSGLAVSYPDYRDWRDDSQSLSGLAASNLYLFGVRTDGGAAAADIPPIYGVFATANYFDVLGVSAIRGRTFQSADDSPSTATVAIVSYRFWQEYLAGAADVIGRQIRVNGRSATVVGVVPPDFGGTLAGVSFDLWVPAAKRAQLVPSDPDWLESRKDRWLEPVGRLRPGVALGQAAAEFRQIGVRAAATFAENRGRSISVEALDIGVAKQLTSLFASLIALTAIVILIVCSNIANLLLVRGASRTREISLRLALGATRGRVIRQLMTENLLLAFAGSSLGVLMASWGRGLVARLLPTTSVPLSFHTPLDLRVLAFVVVVTCVAAIVFGLAPALASSQVHLSGVLNAGGRGTRQLRPRLRAGLVVAQFALCIVALLCTELFMRRADYVRGLDRGFADPGHVLLVQTELSLTGRSDLADWQRTLDRIADAVRRLPGVRSASLATFVPLGFVGYTGADVEVKGYTPNEGELMRFLVNGVAPDYFEVMGIPIREGRAIADEDRPDRPRSAVVNEAFVRRFWRGTSPIGRELLMGGRKLTVVGVAKDGKYDYKAIDSPPSPLIYYALRQSPAAFVTLHVRTQGDPLALISPVRSAIASVDPLVPLLAPVSLDEYASLPMFPSRVGVAVLSVLGVAALLLAAMGLYGLIAYGVTLRSREIGVRLALGASPAHVLGIFLRETAILSVTGIVVGLVFAFAAAVMLRSQLPYLPTPNVVSLSVPAGLLGVVALVAGFVPARRSTLIHPATTLRAD